MGDKADAIAGLSTACEGLATAQKAASEATTEVLAALRKINAAGGLPGGIVLRDLDASADKNGIAAVAVDTGDAAAFQAAKGDKAEITNGSNTATTSAKANIQRQVRFELVVRRLFKLDTVAQTYGAQLKIVMEWDCPDSEDPPAFEDDDGDWVPEWTPKYRIFSLMEELRTEIVFHPTEIPDKPLQVRMEAMHLVTIYEMLELRSFPFDCQDLTIKISSCLSTELVEWVPVKAGTSPVKLEKDRCLLDDFRLIDQFPFTWNLYTIEEELRTSSCLLMQVKVVRKANYYILNVVLVMMLICTFSLCAWSLHPGDIGGRHGVDFALILTAVAFKLILTSMLPPVSYVTLLDKYVMGSFLFLCIVTGSHSALPWLFVTHMDNSPLTLPPNAFEDEETLIYWDLISFYGFAGLWVLFNLGSALYFYCKSMAEKRAFIKAAKRTQKNYDKANNEVVDGKAKLVRLPTESY
eukprot:gnl/TRDRNA2_/TRDRNA2_166308_c0_seq1.p1 gnl/TRDRNA2_/TRDRNA2_166308_c0~~gnl/TRDRNA2_/TRDRNA2_166308_c0_seq1.p1  ORF type:complete len:466 (-),score=86.56 gnl/TRDRNA2_/TRDRNA2_166308_c0_seq1:170-1567(-)